MILLASKHNIFRLARLYGRTATSWKPSGEDAGYYPSLVAMGRRSIRMAALGKRRATLGGGPDLEFDPWVAVRMDHGSLNLTPTATIKLRHYLIFTGLRRGPD